VLLRDELSSLLDQVVELLEWGANRSLKIRPPSEVIVVQDQSLVWQGDLKLTVVYKLARVELETFNTHWWQLVLVSLREREVLRTVTVSTIADSVRKGYDRADIFLETKAPECILSMLLRALRRNHIGKRFLTAGFDAWTINVAILMISFIVEPDHGLSERMNIAVDILGLKLVNFLFLAADLI
jgi:hypothetical protein